MPLRPMRWDVLAWWLFMLVSYLLFLVNNGCGDDLPPTCEELGTMVCDRALECGVPIVEYDECTLWVETLCAVNGPETDLSCKAIAAGEWLR